MTNLSALYGSISKLAVSHPNESYGDISYILDGISTTGYGWYKHTGGSENHPPYHAYYYINLGSEYYCDTVNIDHFIDWGTNSYFNVCDISSYALNFNTGGSYWFGYTQHDYVKGLHENTFNVKGSITGVGVRIDASGFWAGSSSFLEVHINGVTINGVSITSSPIKIKTLSGITTFAKETDLIGPVRYMNDTGIESLALVSTNDIKASNVRIQTKSGIKAIAKI